MNDEFLYQLHEEPEGEFAKRLRERLRQSSYREHRHGVNVQPLINRHPAAKRLALALMALSLAFGLAVAISPAVRAAVTDMIKTIIVRGTTVWVSDDVPACRK